MHLATDASGAKPASKEELVAVERNFFTTKEGIVMRHWQVIGWDGVEVIYQKDFPHSSFSDSQMRVFLKRLVCTTLTFDEIADCSRKRRPKEGDGLLEVHCDATEERFTLSVGIKPHFTASATSRHPDLELTRCSTSAKQQGLTITSI